VARAKRTDRAEARRKYRAYLLDQEEAAAAERSDAAETSTAKPARSRDPRAQQAPIQPGARMGMMAAAKAAYRTTHYRDDVRNAPALIFRSNAIWLPAVISIAGGAYLAQRLASGTYGSDPIAPVLYQFLFLPVPLLPPMIAGFFAPRSAWLAGVLASFIASMVMVVVICLNWNVLYQGGAIAGPNPTPSPSAAVTATNSSAPTDNALVTATPVSSGAPEATASAAPSASPSGSSSSGSSGNTLPLNSSNVMTLTFQLLSQSVVFGALMAALAGWYKRWLALTSGPRKPPPPRSGSARPQRRRPVAKS
jgi:hypothetical protein